MTKARIGGAFAIVLVLLALAIGYRAFRQRAASTPTPAPAIPSSPANPSAEAAAEVDPGFLYGRVTTVQGATYEGRLRWGEGGHQEAFWGDYFNGAKKGNRWGAYVPSERLPKVRDPIKVFGFVILQRERPSNLSRRLMTRFGDISRIEAQGRNVRVTQKNGTAYDLDRFEASDFDDGVRVWDGQRGIVDLDSLVIRTIELLPVARPGGTPNRLHGTVRTRQGAFTGFLQWNREEGVGSDVLNGFTPGGGEVGLRFDTLRSIARRSPKSARVTLGDGREMVLSGTQEVGDGNRGVYVDDPRYGRVLVSWDAFERVDLTPGGGGPAYGDFPPATPLKGTVTTRDGRHLAGRLVFDLDENETIETLDAPIRGVDYTLPFGLIASIVPTDPKEGGGARVTLQDGEQLQLEPTGDLGELQAGMLIFVDGSKSPEYVPWTDVERLDLDRPPAMYPRTGGS